MKSKAKSLAPVTVQQTVGAAFRDVLTHNLGLLAAWEEAACIGDDIEGVHQLRVAFRRLLTRQRRKVVATGEEIDRNAPQEMHLLRIAGKRLRYAAEFFRPLFADMDAFIGHLKQLQDLLGVMNDVAVMHHLLETLWAGESDPETLQYAGALVGWRTRQYYEIKNSFNDRWAEFIEADQPWRAIV